MTSEEVVVTRKGQITIPVQLRRKFGIQKNTKVEVKEEEGRIVIKKQLSILDLAGSGASKASVEEVNQLIDEMRSQDA